jgi:hypothetical protein
MKATVRKHTVNLWNLLKNVPFCMTAKILVIQERAKFKTFLRLCVKNGLKLSLS